MWSKQFILAAAGSTLLACGTSRAADIALSLSVDTNAKTFQAFAEVIDPGNQTLGLHGIEFDVTGSGGLTVTSSALSLLQPTETLNFADFYIKGFKVLRSSGTAGQDIRAFQENSNTLSPLGTGNTNIIVGIGEMPVSVPNGSLPSSNFADPVLIATGSYTGDAGTLTIGSSAALATLLPASLPTATVGGAAFATFSPSSVTGDSFVVPEPATLGLLGLTTLALGRRRRAVDHRKSCCSH